MDNYLRAIREDQRKDKDLMRIKELLELSPEVAVTSLGLDSPTVKYYWAKKDKLQLQDGTLKIADKNSNWRILIPRHKVPEILQLVHDDKSANHRSASKMIPLILQRYHWKSMKADCETHVKMCHSCAQLKLPTIKPRAPLVMTKTSAKFERISVDLVGPLPSTKNGKRYELVGVCTFTKFGFAVQLLWDQ